MAFMTFHSVGNFIIPTDELIFFRVTETTNQKIIIVWNNHSGYHQSMDDCIILYMDNQIGKSS